MDRPPKKMKLKRDVSIEPQAELGWNPQERNPSKVFEESTEETTVSEAILQERERNATRGREHSHTGEPDLKTVEIPPIDLNSESKQEVVEQGEGCTSSDTVC